MTRSNPRDHELLANIAAGDAKSLRQLFDRYAPLMLAVARRILRSEHDAEEVVNDVFLEIWRRPQRFVLERGAPRTYLLLVTRSRAIDRLRALKTRGSEQTVSDAMPSTSATAALDSDPVESAQRKEARTVVRGMLEDLSPEMREAVTLSFVDGLTHQEIAERTNQPLGTVKGRVRRGLIQLRENLRHRRGGGSP